MISVKTSTHARFSGDTTLKPSPPPPLFPSPLMRILVLKCHINSTAPPMVPLEKQRALMAWSSEKPMSTRIFSSSLESDHGRASRGEAYPKPGTTDDAPASVQLSSIILIFAALSLLPPSILTLCHNLFSSILNKALARSMKTLPGTKPKLLLCDISRRLIGSGGIYTTNKTV